MIRRPPRSTQSRSSAASDVYKRQADVEAVRILHDELAGAQHAALGPRLVTLLGLDVVPELRQLLVAVHLARGQPGDDLFVGHGQGHIGALAVLEAEELAADGVPAPGPVSYTHLRAHETRHDLVCRLLLEKKKK